jgi:hypothetical protein
MTSRPATIPVFLCLLATLSGCAALRSATLTALGRGDKETLEAQRLNRAARAADLPEEEIDRRLTFLVNRLDERQFHAAAWKYTWLVVNGGGVIVSAVQAGLADDGTDQANEIAQAGKAAIGTTYLLVNPMPGTSGADPIREMPGATRQDKLAQLAGAEELLAREAERAKDRTSWLLHLGNLFINAAAAAPALALGDEALAAESFGIGAAVGVIQILSQPWKGPSDWDEYERFVAGYYAAPEPTAEWQIMPHGLGIGIAGRF